MSADVTPKRRRRFRRTRIFLVALLLMLGGALVVPQSANAACAVGVSSGTDEPTPEMPGTGIMGFFEGAPAQLPPDADPFKAGSNTTIQEQYGYAGLTWNTFDLGCGGALANPVAAALNSWANMTMIAPKAMVGIAGSMLQSVYAPGFLKIFDPLVESVTASMGQSVFTSYLPLGLAILALVLVWRNRSASLAQTAMAIGSAMVICVIAAFLFSAPLLAGHAADAAVQGVNATLVGGINGKSGSSAALDTATEVTANLHKSLLYQSWLGGELGRSSGPIADKYGPDLFKAQAMTWREKAAYDADPSGKGNDIIEAKHQLWDDTTQKIKDEDPIAYSNLTGTNAIDRLGYAWLASLAVWCAVPFLLMSCMLIVVALLIVRVAVMAFPVLAAFGVVPQMRHLVTGVGNVVMAALINCVVFTMGSALLVRLIGMILAPSSGSPFMFFQIVLMLAATVLMWFFLKPFRKLTAMVGKKNHFGDSLGAPAAVGHKVGRAAWGAVKTAGAAYVGGTAGAKAGAKAILDDLRESEAEERAETETTTTETTTTYAPTPEPTRPALPMASVEPDDVRNPDREARERGIPAQPTAPAQESRPGPSEAAATEQDAQGNTVYKIYSPSDGEVFRPSAGASTGGEE